MAVRSGMTHLIDRVRSLANAGFNEYTVGNEIYWPNESLQNILDSNKQLLVGHQLTWIPQTIGGGTISYQVAEAAYRDFEEAGSGTAQWIVRDGTGAQIGTANYSADYRAGRLTFSANQGGSIYYLTAYTYDVYAAAADVWLQRLAHFSDWYDFSADNQTFSRAQAFDHATAMEKTLRSKSGQNLVSNAAGELRMAYFWRSDLND